MSESEFLAMEPRERDALVAEKVMGKDVRCTCDFCLPTYTTSIAAAWQVVEKINREHGPFHLRDVCHRFGDDAPIFWRAWFESTGPKHESYVDADTAPLAICIAALKAVGEIHA